MASVIYNNFKKELMNKTFDLVNDTVKIALVTSSYTPNIDTHTVFSDVTNEVSGTGYTTGGNTLGTKTVTSDTTDDEGVFDAADTSWSSSSITARGAVVYDTTATSKLICYIDFGADYTSVNGTFAIVFNSEGIVNIN